MKGATALTNVLKQRTKSVIIACKKLSRYQSRHSKSINTSKGQLGSNVTQQQFFVGGKPLGV